MRISGQRIKRTRLVYTDRYIFAVNVELVIPEDDLTEPCYDSETVSPRSAVNHPRVLDPAVVAIL